MSTCAPSASNPSRERLLDRASSGEVFDLVVIGGGATGLGVAVDAAARGFSTALFEAEDFAKGTSSRATKLVHGGARYLAQGNVSLVREALRERKLLLANAPHLAGPLAFIVPSYGLRGRFWDMAFLRTGLGLYDALAGTSRQGPTRCLGRKALLEASPGVRSEGLVGGVRYWDGQFDDARLAVALARTAIREGACVLNYCRVTGLLSDRGTAVGRGAGGVVVEDRETGRSITVRARCVVNATGVWVDAVRRLDDPQAGDTVSPSQGAHVVVDREFFPSDQALLVPRTADGRVLFAVPWLGKVILGTTDMPRADLPLEPKPWPEEIDFILREASGYLERAPSRSDILSAWAGLRPLVRLVGAPTAAAGSVSLAAPPGRHLYGSEASLLAALPGADVELVPGLSEAMVRFAVRHEYARTVEDVLARRSRQLFLDARAAASVAGSVAAIMAAEIGSGFRAAASQAAFLELADAYLPHRGAGKSPG